MKTPNIWEEVTDNFDYETGGQRWLHVLDKDCWISVLHRRTGFGWMEWETAIVFLIKPGDRPKRFASDNRDVLIIAGDRREELSAMPKEKLREWYNQNIEGNRNSFDSILYALRIQE